MIKTLGSAFVAAAIAASAAAPASAAVFVAGDSNIYMTLTTQLLPSVNPGNQAFFRNILDGGTKAVVQFGFLHASIAPTFVSGYYSTLGVSTTTLAAATTVTAADLSGASLFITSLPNRAYTSGEISTIASFVAGGGNLLVSGEHDGFASWNSNVNALLTGIGSGMRIVPDQLDANALFVGQPQTISHYLTGTAGFQFGATSRVSGGTGLFGTQTTNQTMLAVEGAVEPPVGGVPEPASWALLISGFGLTGAALRRRRAAAA